MSFVGVIAMVQTFLPSSTTGPFFGLSSTHFCLIKLDKGMTIWAFGSSLSPNVKLASVFPTSHEIKGLDPELLTRNFWKRLSTSGFGNTNHDVPVSISMAML